MNRSRGVSIKLEKRRNEYLSNFYGIYFYRSFLLLIRNLNSDTTAIFKSQNGSLRGSDLVSIVTYLPLLRCAIFNLANLLCARARGVGQNEVFLQTINAPGERTSARTRVPRDIQFAVWMNIFHFIRQSALFRSSENYTHFHTQLTGRTFGQTAELKGREGEKKTTES